MGLFFACKNLVPDICAHGGPFPTMKRQPQVSVVSRLAANRRRLAVITEQQTPMRNSGACRPCSTPRTPEGPR